MRIISFDENRRIQLELLSYFDEYCNDNGLTYFLGYGSLIGAIRHNGFIPWDDDIDLLMPRKDYEALISFFEYNNKKKHIKLISPMGRNAKHPIVKIFDNRTVKIEQGIKYKSADEYLGIDLDIFPIDGQPDDEHVFVNWKRKLVQYYKAFSLMCMDSSQLWKRARLEKTWYKIVFRNKQNALLKAKHLHQLYPYENCEYVGVCESMYVDEGDRVNRRCYEYPIKHVFEDKEFNIPVGYEEILTNIYGDYMELPPIEQRQAHHINNVFWRE